MSANIAVLAVNVVRSAWQRTGAFVGTVVTVVAADRIARQRKNDVIGAIGKSFSNTLGAAMGSDMSVAEYQRGGYPVIDGSKTNVLPPRSVWAEGYDRANDLYPHLRSKPVPYFWAGIYYRLLHAFPQVPTPFVLETWEQAACRLFDFQPETWEDAKYLAELVHVLKSNCGTDGI